ncbi:MAG: Smr/MutS family protein [Myxococcota bacterium]
MEDRSHDQDRGEDSGIDERTLETLDWDVVLRALSALARTPLGQRAAARPDFATSREDVLERYQAVSEVIRLELEEGMHVPTGGIGDIVEILDIAGAGQVLEGEQLREVGHCMGALSRLRRWLDEQRALAPSLRDLADPIQLDVSLQERLIRSFDETGSLSEKMYPQLADLRSRIRSLNQRIQNVLSDLIGNDSSLGAMLQDRFITEREGRYVLPLKAGYRRNVGIAHGTSQSGETVYVEPLAVVAHTNELKEADAALKREIRRILAELSRGVAGEIEPLLTALDASVDIDLAVARARLGGQLQASIPTVGTDGRLLLYSARHPVLQLRGVDVIGNTLQLSRQHPGLVLTGPNAGGKTVAMKTLGLCALMVRAGLPIPAEADSRADYFAHISADIGDLQTVEGDLSTFSGHLMSLKTVLAQTGPNSLVLLDEVGMGTDPAQGAALAQAVIQTLVDQGARLAVTTHYTRLKELPGSDPRFRVGAVRFVDGSPTYHFDLDQIGESHALAIARRLRFPLPVLERARGLLNAGERRVEELVARLEEEQAILRADQESLARAQKQIADERTVLAHRGRALEERRRVLEAELSRDFRARVRAQEEEIKGLIAALQANPDLKTAGKTLKQIRRLRDDVAASAPETDAPPPPAPADLAVGDRVQLRTLGSRGTISRILGNDRFEVQIGAMKMKVELSALVEGGPILSHRNASAASNKKARRAPKMDLPPPVEREMVSVRTDANTCDLRGKRVDEALDASSQFLDDMVRRNESVVYLLHGHGTGALKTAIRQWLPTARQARRWRPAHPQEGGDAFTLVELS